MSGGDWVYLVLAIGLVLNGVVISLCVAQIRVLQEDVWQLRIRCNQLEHPEARQ